MASIRTVSLYPDVLLDLPNSANSTGFCNVVSLSLMWVCIHLTMNFRFSASVSEGVLHPNLFPQLLALFWRMHEVAERDEAMIRVVRTSCPGKSGHLRNPAPRFAGFEWSRHRIESRRCQDWSFLDQPTPATQPSCRSLLGQPPACDSYPNSSRIAPSPLTRPAQSTPDLLHRTAATLNSTCFSSTEWIRGNLN